jgi:hypothetical protein
MATVASVYNRLERAARREDLSPLHAWMGGRSDRAVQEAIKHGVRMATDDDYRLGVEAYRFVKHYEDAADVSGGGLGAFSLNKEQKQRVTALREGAARLRYGGMTEAGRTGIRREVERLLGVMRAEIEPTPAPAREYRYGAQFRPIGFATVPAGYVGIEPPIEDQPKTRHGVVVYDRPLTPDEITGYELVPYMPVAEVVAHLYDGLARYGAKYAEAIRDGDAALLRSPLGSRLDRLNVYTDVPNDRLFALVVDEVLRRHPA